MWGEDSSKKYPKIKILKESEVVSMSGRPKKPAVLLEAEGRSHLSVREIQNRKEQELVVPFKNIETPTYLSSKLKKNFEKIAKMLLDLDIFTELDVDCLARYVLAQDLYLKYTKAITKELKKDDEDVILSVKELQNLQDKAFKQAQSSARDLGLTITSRCKIVVPLPREDEDDEL